MKEKVGYTFYICDPLKNTKCKKENCKYNGGRCYTTEYLEFAKTTKDGKILYDK